METNNELSLDEQIEQIENQILSGKGGRKRLKFCRNYAVHCNGAQAARETGYSVRSARQTAADILANPDIQRLISLYHKREARDLQISPERILTELAKVGFANMADFVEAVQTAQDQVDSDGEAENDQPTTQIQFKDLASIPLDKTACIKSIKVSEFKGGKGGRAQERKIEFQLHDKLSALDSIARHIDFFGADSSNKDQIVLNVSPAMDKLLNDEGANND